MTSLPLVELIPLILVILTVLITILAIYKYLKIEKRKTDLIIGVAFLLLTLALIAEIFNPTFDDNNLGGLFQYLRVLAYLVFLIAIEPIKIINAFRGK